VIPTPRTDPDNQDLFVSLLKDFVVFVTAGNLGTGTVELMLSKCGQNKTSGGFAMRFWSVSGRI
jgi:hypothetical protein